MSSSSSSGSSSPASRAKAAAESSPSKTTSPKPAPADAQQKPSPNESFDARSDKENGEIFESDSDYDSDSPTGAANGPPLPKEPLPGAAGADGTPPLPSEPVPTSADDGWDYRWDFNLQTYVFFNRFTGAEQLDNPRVPTSGATALGTAPTDTAPVPMPSAQAVLAAATATAVTTTAPAADPARIDPEDRSIGGYNPAIHGSYDPNAWYAKLHERPELDDPANPLAMANPANPYDVPSDPYASTATFNRFTVQFQADDQGPGRHSDDSKTRRQMNAFFDVDAAANAHDGRSLKAERSGKKPTKAELKAFKEKRRAKKEEKRRAWLRD